METPTRLALVKYETDIYTVVSVLESFHNENDLILHAVRRAAIFKDLNVVMVATSNYQIHFQECWATLFPVGFYELILDRDIFGTKNHFVVATSIGEAVQATMVTAKIEKIIKVGTWISGDDKIA